MIYDAKVDERRIRPRLGMTWHYRGNEIVEPGYVKGWDNRRICMNVIKQGVRTGWWSVVLYYYITDAAR